MSFPAHFAPFARLRQPCLMGIVNITPDSFSDAGQFFEPAAAIDHARELARQGAHILDFGAEASSFFRPGVEPVPAHEQIRRLVPVLQALRDLPEDVLLSVDTRSAEVADAALQAGAHIINDISAGRHDPNLLKVVASHNAAIVLMHMGPLFPATPATDDLDIVRTVQQNLAERHACAVMAGIPEHCIALDPGIGFGKTMADNWRLAFQTQRISLPDSRSVVVLGASRKRFLETQPPSDVPVPAGWDELLDALKSAVPHSRDPISAALTAFAARQGVGIHRVHNVALAARAIGLLPTVN